MMRVKRHKLMRSVSQSMFMIFIIFLGESSFAVEDDPRIVPALRKFAAELGWAQNIFVGVKGPKEDLQVFGIADIPITDLPRVRKKSYVQWLSSEHRYPLEKAYNQHIEAYRKLGFEITPLEGLGLKAYQAHLESYVAKGKKELELAESQDVIEIFSEGVILTLRDDHTDLEANAAPLFQKIYDILLKDKLIQPIPNRTPNLKLKSNIFENFPKKINLSNLFLDEHQLPLNPKEWLVKDINVREKRGEDLALSSNYRYFPIESHYEAIHGGPSVDTSPGTGAPAPAIARTDVRQSMELQKRISKPEVKVFLYAYSSPAEAKYFFKRYLKRLKSEKSLKIEKQGSQACWILKKSEKKRYIFMQDIFVFDLDLDWKDAKREDAEGLLNSFSSHLKENIKKLWHSSEDPQVQN